MYITDNRSYSVSPHRFKSHDSNTISVYNDSDEVIPAWTAVRPGELFSRNDISGKVVFYAVIAENDSLPWGVVTTCINPGCFGNLLMSGVVPALVNGGVCGELVSPVDGELYPSASGRAEILEPGDEYAPGLILMGAASGGENGYEGQFKVEVKDSNTCRVFWGIARSSGICGTTDVPGFEDGIPTAEVSIPESGKLYMNFEKDETGDGYSLYFDGTGEAVLNKLLCSFDEDEEGNIKGVTQLFTDNDGIKFSREYFL